MSIYVTFVRKQRTAAHQYLSLYVYKYLILWMCDHSTFTNVGITKVFIYMKFTDTFEIFTCRYLSMIFFCVFIWTSTKKMYMYLYTHLDIPRIYLLYKHYWLLHACTCWYTYVYTRNTFIEKSPVFGESLYTLLHMNAYICCIYIVDCCAHAFIYPSISKREIFSKKRARYAVQRTLFKSRILSNKDTC